MMIKNYRKFISLNENKKNNFYVELSDQEFTKILNEKCKEFLNNGVYFYRGDDSLTEKNYIINTKNIKREEKFKFNHYSNIFTSSNLWKNKGLPLRKNSINFTNDIVVSNRYSYSKTSYYLIPFDGSKIVCMPKKLNKAPTIFNNYSNPKVNEEFKDLGKIPITPSGELEPYLLNQVLYTLSDITLDVDSNINDVELSLKTIQNKFSKNLDLGNDLYNNIFNKIKENLKKHNMSFIEYMNYLYSPDNYIIMNYGDMDNKDQESFDTFYCDSNVLMTKENPIKLSENLTTNRRWGKVGAGILPYCKKTKRFLISLRSPYVLEPGTWGLWGGKLDDVDTNNIIFTAKREFKEETGYNGKIDVIPSYIYKETDFIYYNFIGIVKNEFKPHLNWESQNYKWVTLEELLEIEPKHFGLEKLINNEKILSYE